MTDRDMARAARRLKLPAPHLMSVSEADEARLCIGCHAYLQHDMKVVHCYPTCPVHGSTRQVTA